MFNLLKTAVLMAAITALFMAIGALLGGRSGMMLALAFALAMNFFSYWFSDKLVLRMYNARQVDESSAPQFYRMVQELAQRAGLPMPRVYLIEEDAPNAFATGRNPQNAAVAVNTDCTRCSSFAFARQVVLTPYRRVVLDGATREQIAETNAEAEQIVSSSDDFLTIRGELNQLVDHLVATVQADIDDGGPAPVRTDQAADQAA